MKIRNKTDHNRIYGASTLHRCKKKKTNAFLVDIVLRDWFKSSTGVRQGCILSPYSIQHFLRTSYDRNSVISKATLEIVVGRLQTISIN